MIAAECSTPIPEVERMHPEKVLRLYAAAVKHVRWKRGERG